MHFRQYLLQTHIDGWCLRITTSSVYLYLDGKLLGTHLKLWYGNVDEMISSCWGVPGISQSVLQMAFTPTYALHVLPCPPVKPILEELGSVLTRSFRVYVC